MTSGNVPEVGDPALVDYAGDQANARRAAEARIDELNELLAKAKRQLASLARRLHIRFESEQQLTAERDALQARIDAALRVIDLSEGFGGEPTLAEVRTTLLGEVAGD